MIPTRYLWPLLIVVAGGGLLTWQHHLLMEARSAAATRGAGGSSSPTRPAAGLPSTGRLTPLAGASASGGAVIDLAELTGGLEASFDPTKSSALSPELVDAVARLTPEQAIAAFAQVTSLLTAMPAEGAINAERTDPAQKRALMLFTPLIGWLQREAPVVLLEWLANPGLPDGVKSATGGFFAETMRSFAATHPEEAVEWLASRGSALPAAGQAWSAALGALAKTDVTRALREATDRSLLPEVSMTMIPALRSAEARRQWSEAVATLDDPAERGRRWASLVNEQSLTAGGQAAIEVLVNELPAEAMTAENVAVVLGAGLGEEPAALAGRVAALPESIAAATLPDFIGRWTERDFNAAASWLGAVPAEAPWRDAAVSSFVGKIRSLDPEAARTWAATIKDPVVREQAGAHPADWGGAK